MAHGTPLVGIAATAKPLTSKGVVRGPGRDQQINITGLFGLVARNRAANPDVAQAARLIAQERAMTDLIKLPRFWVTGFSVVIIVLIA